MEDLLKKRVCGNSSMKKEAVEVPLATGTSIMNSELVGVLLDIEDLWKFF